MSLRILRLAAGATLQDGGRPGWRSFGVPPGGAFDRESYALALALAGCETDAVLEIPMMGGEFEAIGPDRIAVVGAQAQVEVGDRALPMQASFVVQGGERVRIGPAILGARAYLACQTGWNGVRLLGSYSNQPPLEPSSAAGDEPKRGGHLRLESEPESLRERPLCFVAGPQALSADLEALESAAFRVGLHSNRIGLRLEGGRFRPPEERPSEPSCPGAVQLTPSGELIVHGPDGPTVGGYPKIAVVADVDLDRLAQLRPGDAVRLRRIEMEEARELSLRYRHRIRQSAARIRACVS